METRRIGSLEVSVIGLGCNNFGHRLDARATDAVVTAALDAGITFFDTADVYGGTRSEALLGRALGRRRHGAVIATKFGNAVDAQRRGGATPRYIRTAVEDSLRRLATDWIDLYQLHRFDTATPLAETFDALAALVRAGKVREVGICNVSPEQITQAATAARAAGLRVACVQGHYSVLQRGCERGARAAAASIGAAFLPSFPLASGLLTGKYRRGSSPPAGTRLAEPGDQAAYFLDDQKLRRVESLTAFAASRGHTVLELALSWLLAQPALASVIAGATTPEQVRANALARWPMEPGELAMIDALAPVDGDG